MIEASAPGKVILFGEHAVVYGRPAIAVPVTQVRATATVQPQPPGSGLILDLPDVNERLSLSGAPDDHPLIHVTRLALARLRQGAAPDWLVMVRSTIPVASGMGSGAAVATAIVRALAQAAGQPLEPAHESALVYESEKLFHGTPSGIDNTVVAFEQPVWFVKGQPPQPFAIGSPFTLVIADTGIASPTSVVVGDVRRAWQADPGPYEALFDAIAGLVRAARLAIEEGNAADLGPLMDENHRLLQALGVSCPELDALWAAARAAGAPGAKLSGAGRGGNLIALAPLEAEATDKVVQAVKAAGARNILVTMVGVNVITQP